MKNGNIAMKATAKNHHTTTRKKQPFKNRSGKSKSDTSKTNSKRESDPLQKLLKSQLLDPASDWFGLQDKALALPIAEAISQ